MLKIFYLVCGDKVNFNKELVAKIKQHDYDVVFLAHASKLIDNITKDLPGYYVNKSSSERGISVLSKTPFTIIDVDYKINHPKIDALYQMDQYKERLLLVEVCGKEIVVVNAPHHKPFKQIYMVKLTSLVKQEKPSLVIGNFNTGYLEDALDEEGFVFTTGLLTFDTLEKLGYVDLNKNQGSYSCDTLGKRERLDHAFFKHPYECLESRYIDMIKLGFDHKGMQVKLKNE